MKKVKDICLAINNTDFIFKDKEEIEKKILFIKNILSVDEFSNPLFLSIIPFTANMLIGIFNEIIDKINFFFIEKLKLSIAPFDRDLENTIKTSAEIIREFELSKTTLKELLESELKKKEEQSAKSVASVEYKINSLHEEGKYNPVNSFKSIMTLNGVVSFFVFLLGGCAGYNKTSIKSTDEYNIIAVTMLITAIKWGIYTFVVGLFMSGIGSLYTLFKNVVRKQQLVLLLKKVKDSLEIEKERVRSKYAAKEVLLNENYKQLTDENSKSVDRIKSRKAELESKLKAEYDIEKSVIILPLQTSIDSLANIVQHI